MNREIEQVVEKAGIMLDDRNQSEVVDTLRSIYIKKGVLRVEDALTHAADPDSPLHGLLEWDDTEAGARYRELQMLQIIRRVKIHIVRPEQEERQIRMFVSRPSMRGQGYEHIESVINDQSKMDELLAGALTDLRAFQKKYEMLQELSDLFWKIDEVVEKLTPKQRKKSA